MPAMGFECQQSRARGGPANRHSRLIRGSLFQRLLDRGAPSLHHRVDRGRQIVWQKVGNPHDPAASLAVSAHLEGRMVMRRVPLDDRVGEPPGGIVEIDDPLADNDYDVPTFLRRSAD